MEQIVEISDKLLKIAFVAAGAVTAVGGVSTSLKYVAKGDAHGAIRSVLGFALAYGVIRFLPWIVKMIDTVFSTM